MALAGGPSQKTRRASRHCSPAGRLQRPPVRLVLRHEERPDSDVDLLIDMAEDRCFGDYLAFVEELESVLSRRVDVVIERSLSPHFRPYIEAEAQPL